MIRALVVIAWCATAARADVITLPNTKVTIDVPPAWQRVEVPGLVLGARGPADELLAITRVRVPNPDAWRSKKRDAYIDQIERGVTAKIKGYRRMSRKLADVNGIPTLDLEAKRGDGATIRIRVLLYRTYALALAIELPRRAPLQDARTIAASFAPLPAQRIEP